MPARTVIKHFEMLIFCQVLKEKSIIITHIIYINSIIELFFNYVFL